MDHVLRHRGCIGSIEYSAPDRLFHGKLLGIPDLITYEGANADALVQDFEEAVADYFDLCEETGKTPVAYADEAAQDLLEQAICGAKTAAQ